MLEGPYSGFRPDILHVRFRNARPREIDSAALVTVAVAWAMQAGMPMPP